MADEKRTLATKNTYNFFATVFATVAELIYICLQAFLLLSNPLQYHGTTQEWNESERNRLSSAGEFGRFDLD